MPHYFNCYWKFPLLCLVLTATKIRCDSSLRSRWSLPDLPTSLEFTDDEAVRGFDFVFDYPVSRDVATEDNISVHLYDRGCQYNDGNQPVELIKGTSEELVIPASASSSTEPKVMTSLEVTLGAGEMNVASLLQEYPSLWDQETSQISYCVRFSLMIEDIEVNFVETIVILDVTLEGVGFHIDEMNVEPKQKIESITEVSFNVTAYMCDGQYRPLHDDITGAVDKLYKICDHATGEIKTVSETTETTTNGTEDGQLYQQELSEAQKGEPDNFIYMQGSVVRVCIRPDDTNLGDVSMRTIQEMVFEGTVIPSVAEKMSDARPTTFVDKEKGIYTQVAVQNGSADVSSGLSAMSCGNNRLEGREDVVVCAIDTLLVADFYWRRHGIVATVKAYGNAALRFGSSGVEDSNQDSGDNLRRAEIVDDEAPLHKYEHEHEPERVLQAQAVSLDTYWNMTRPEVDFPGIDKANEGFDFRMNYTVSDAIASDMIHLEIWEKNCQQIGKEPELVYSPEHQSPSHLLEITLTDAIETGDGSGTQIITVNGRWRREQDDFFPMLMQSPYYKESSDQALVQISLCVRYQLHSKPDIGGFEVNFLETPIFVNIDLSADLTFDIAVDLISDEDECLEELEAELQLMGMGGVDDLFASNLYWRPGARPADPTMPMGPSLQRPISPFSFSYSELDGHFGASSPVELKRTNYQLIGSSADASKHSWIITTTIGIIAFFFLSLR